MGNLGDWVVSEVVEVATVSKYYTFGGQRACPECNRRVAMRQGDEVYYLHGDHLGSTSLTTDASGAVVAESRYLPYGQERWAEGTLPTDFTFTGQRGSDFGLMDYRARFYSPLLGRFVSPDTIVPEPTSSGGFNRYRYTRNNPLKYVDPSGHHIEMGAGGSSLVPPLDDEDDGEDDAAQAAVNYQKHQEYRSQADEIHGHPGAN